MPDFYEKFWARIYRYISSSTENLLWNLLENYSEKEKSVNQVYNERIQNLDNDKKSTRLYLEKKASLSGELKVSIRNLRNDFYKRARRIILSSEMSN